MKSRGNHGTPATRLHADKEAVRPRAFHFGRLISTFGGHDAVSYSADASARRAALRTSALML
jgi:hypothetical protein